MKNVIENNYIIMSFHNNFMNLKLVVKSIIHNYQEPNACLQANNITCTYLI